jgi:hypothetical protein
LRHSWRTSEWGLARLWYSSALSQSVCSCYGVVVPYTCSARLYSGMEWNETHAV